MSKVQKEVWYYVVCTYNGCEEPFALYEPTLKKHVTDNKVMLSCPFCHRKQEVEIDANG